MAGETVNRIHRILITGRSALRREGRLGLALLVLALLVYVTVLSPLYSQQLQLQQDIDDLNKQVHASLKQSMTEPTTTAEQLFTYYQFFPAQSTAPNWLNKIFTAARDQHLDLPEGKYRVIHERAGSLLRYEITLPVTGSYQQLHKFIAAVLSEIPIAALDGVTFERNKISNALIDAKFKISLYLGQPA
ncbi:MAG: type 4a pilus biogenesis protein PilO [Gammaproteobacteria bacterium]|nr:type 4a pilus biogenesis protein PilO [Gammaproteobacteria bacterium]